MARIQHRDEHQQDVGRRGHAGLGRREPAGQDAPHDDDRDHHRQGRATGRDEDVHETCTLLHGAHGTEEVAVDHQPDADQHARHHAAEEQPADRHVAGGAVDHRHDRQRDQVGHGRGRGDERCREGAIVALLVHLGRHGAAQHRDVGGRGARDAGKEHAEQGDDLGEPPAQVPHQRLGESDHAMSHVGRRHQLADEEEEGDGQERLGVDAMEQLADHRLEADRSERRRRQHARDDRERHGHTHVTQQQEQASHQHYE